MATQQAFQSEGGQGMQNQGGNAPTQPSLDTEVEDLGDRTDAATDAGQNGLDEGDDANV